MAYDHAKNAYENSNYSQSLAWYHSALPSLERPFLDTALYHMGYCQLQLDSNIEAYKSFMRCVELDYRKADAFFNMGLIQYALFNDSLAMCFFYNVLAIDSTHKAALEQIRFMKKMLSHENQSV